MKTPLLVKTVFCVHGGTKIVACGPHDLRKQVYNRIFNGKREDRVAPERPRGTYRLDQWQRVKENRIPLKKSGMTQLTGFYRLPYFKVS
jgi:hypothetical protein